MLVRNISKQISRDIACATIFVAAGALYVENLISYLSGLNQPGWLILAFVGSLGIALFHETTGGIRRLSLVHAAAVTLTFALGVPLAHWLRDFYMGMLGSLAEVPEAVTFIGADNYAAMTNRTIGYGSCFAMGLMLVRWCVHKHVAALLVRILICSENIPVICPHCQQPMIGQKAMS